MLHPGKTKSPWIVPVCGAALVGLLSLSCTDVKTASLTLAVDALERHDYREARDKAAIALAADASNPLAVEISAISLRMLGDQPESSAMRQYQASLPRRELSKEEQALKPRVDRQSAAFLRTLAAWCGPEALHFADQAGMLASQGRIYEAEVSVGKAIAMSPDCEPAYFNRAVMAYRRGDSALARRSANEVLRINPANEKAKQMLQMVAPAGQ